MVAIQNQDAYWDNREQILRSYSQVLKRNGTWNDDDKRVMVKRLTKELNKNLESQKEILYELFPKLQKKEEREEQIKQLVGRK